MTTDEYVEDARSRWLRAGGRLEDFDVFERRIRLVLSCNSIDDLRRNGI